MADKAWLFFEVGPVSLAVEATAVEEILPRGPLTPVPLAPPRIPGVMSFRGEALPLLDLGVWLSAAGEAPRTVVACRTRSYRVGLLCHRARGVRAVAADAAAAPRLAEPASLRAVALGELEDERGLHVLLDLDALLESTRVRG
ncbi:MAG: chemotaxis protein CheW [Sandaracinaceae bacterium]|nr:chemotaxis protein CheW [Sandaracinaceae bacterium]